ncbi:Rft protein-domain-containing protein [Phakopsora pachyrhizi]|uniref:Man(5)GlcNAc(2)-PP-dolichol translocation protein RFT1 n=1 Tax=Phakopsora pachyrhizi TaxID=170000 RepID=A0AAV0AHY1_PHAPC|nr:Rft protein-domain-containing protein [Phakopsora pachyrhizi]
MGLSLTNLGLSLIGLQLISRLSTFVLNQALIRLVSPESLGRSSVQFEVLINTILFLSRESIRINLSRSQDEFKSLMTDDENNSHGGDKELDCSEGPSKVDFNKAVKNFRKRRKQQILNISFLSIPLGFITSTVLFTTYYYYSDLKTLSNEPRSLISKLNVPEPSRLSGLYLFCLDRFDCLKASLFIYYVSSLIELMSEPAYLYLILIGRVDRRIRVEGLSLLTRTFLNFTIVFLGSYLSTPLKSFFKIRSLDSNLFDDDQFSLLAFSLGQLGFSLTLLIGLWFNVLEQSNRNNNKADNRRFDLVPQNLNVDGQNSLIKLENWLDYTELKLCFALFRQSILKQFLTEGDKMFIAKFCPIANQGGYALAMNYGSLVARIVFHPIEETSRLFFSKNLSNPSLILSSKEPELAKNKDIMIKSQEKEESSERSVQLLLNLIKFYNYLGLILISFGPPYIQLLLTILIGTRSDYLREGNLSTVVIVLKTYCFLLPLLGINGVLEGFCQSVSNQAQLDRMSKMMIFWCVAFIAAVRVFSSDYSRISLGVSSEVAIVLATVVNMICRIIFGWNFLVQFSKTSHRNYISPKNTQTIKSTKSNSTDDDKENYYREVGSKGIGFQKCLPSYIGSMSFLIFGYLTRLSESSYILINNDSNGHSEGEHAGDVSMSMISHVTNNKTFQFKHILIGFISFTLCFFITLLSERKNIEKVFKGSKGFMKIKNKND